MKTVPRSIPSGTHRHIVPPPIRLAADSRKRKGEAVYSRLGGGVASLVLSLALGTSALAIQIDFTGGTVVRNDASTETTNNSDLWDAVDYYDESGFRLDFIGGELEPFSANVGDYYSASNDVAHGHWATGDFGGLTQIKVTKIDGTAFDLNYFVLTSNTDTGGEAASGNEQARIHASLDGTTSSFSQLLPPEDWGFPGEQIFLGPEFDGIKAFWFEAENPIDCFGMDEFFIDEEAPPPEGPLAIPTLSGWAASLLAGLLGMIGWRVVRRGGA